MSSIRLFILGALADAGDMHGHQLRQLAEKEHIDRWTDVTPGGLYGAIKRMSAEGLIEEVRTEQQGAYPERQVWGITDAGRVALGSLRVAGLREIVLRPDPFDLALARMDRHHLDVVPDLIRLRVDELRLRLEQDEEHTRRISQYLTPVEHFVMRHRADRLRADIAWHEELLEQLPELLADELSRKDDPRD